MTADPPGGLPMAAARVRSRRMGRVRSAIAAGGVVFRGGLDALEVALAGRRSDGSWVFPKGTPDGDESIEETALREVEEETGLKVRITAPLGTMEYWFAAAGERVHKFVHFYLMEPVGGDVSLHDHEYDEVRWVPVAEARRMLSFDTYREVLDRALAARGEGAPAS
ncbi:MAG: NUDIX hydrolase [Candidatus Limnocylindria bacterium]